MHTNARKYEIDMTRGPLLGKVLLFALPLMASSMLQLLFNAADIIVVGRFGGPNSIGAVGSTGSLINLLVSSFIGLSVGVNVLTARYFAARHEKNLRETVHTAILISLVAGVVIGAIGFLLAKPILTLMGSPGEVLRLATLYMRIYFLGMPVVLLYNFGSAILRAIGDTRRPLYYLAFAGIVNVGLNLFFVIVCHLDVAGVAIATIVSQAISALLILQSLVRTDAIYRVRREDLRISRDKLMMILRIGLPAGLQGTVFSFSNVLVQSSVNSFGELAVAGNAAAVNLEGFVYMAMNSFAQASITFTSQNYGARQHERIPKVLLTCLALVSAVGLIMGLGFHFGSRGLLSIYTTDARTIEYGVLRMTYICALYFLCGVMDVLAGAVRGIGWSVVPTIVSLLGACALRVVWILTVFRAYRSLQILYLAYPITWVVTATAHLVAFLYAWKMISQERVKEADYV